MTKSITNRKFNVLKQDAVAYYHRSALRAQMVDAPKAKDILKMFPPKVRNEVCVSMMSYSDTLHFSLTLRDLDSLKDTRLTKVLEAFAVEGWDARSSDYVYDVPNRDFHFGRTLFMATPSNAHSRWLVKNAYMNADQSIEMRVSVIISAYVKADSDSCRIEVVDRVEKVVIEEVKKIVCA